jgi:hypothetical protein
MPPLSLLPFTQPVARNTDERNDMFDPITTPVLYEASRPRRRYDNPPVVMDIPRWTRTRALAARVSTGLRRSEPARAPQPACGAQGR